MIICDLEDDEALEQDFLLEEVLYIVEILVVNL